MNARNIAVAAIISVALTALTLTVQQTANAGQTDELYCATLGCEQKEDRLGWPLAIMVRPHALTPEDEMPYKIVPLNLVIDLALFLALAYGILKLWTSRSYVANFISNFRSQ